MKDDIVIVSAARTPVGAFNGTFSASRPMNSARSRSRSALERAGVERTRERGHHRADPDRRSGPEPGAPGLDRRRHPGRGPAWGVNQLCGSGLRAVALGYQQILNGDADIVVAGGQESMSQAPHCAHLRNGAKMGSRVIDTMIKDGLWDAFNGYHMGNTAENVAKKWQITRQQQDEFAVKSQNKAEAAQKAGRFKDEITPVTIKTARATSIVDADEYP